MMRIFSLLVLFLLTFSSAVMASTVLDDYYLKYYIDVGQKQKGMLVVKKQGNNYSSSYYKIDKSDKLPFFAPKKQGSFVDGFKATALQYSGNKLGIYYDKATVVPIFKKFSMGTGNGRALVMDEKSKRPKMSIENIPAVSFEGILIGAINKTLPMNQEMIFVDASKASGMKIYFKETAEGSSSGGCDVTTIQCLRKNVDGQADVALFSIQLVDGHIPKVIESGSKRWRLSLDAYTRDYRTISEDLIAKEIAHGESHVKQALQNNVRPQVSVSSRQGGRIKYQFSLDANLASAYDEETLLAGVVRKNLGGQLSGGLFSGSFLKKDNAGYVATIDKERACDVLSKGKEYEFPKREYSSDCSSASYMKKKWLSASELGPTVFPQNKCAAYVIEDAAFSDSLICVATLSNNKLKDEGADAAEDKKVDLEDAVKIYLKAKKPEILSALDDITPAKGQVYFTYKVEESIPAAQLDTAAVSAFARELKASRSKVQSYVKKFGQNYILRINGKDLDAYRVSLAQGECRTLAKKLSGTKSRYSGGVCRLNGSFALNFSEFYNQLERKIYKDRPDLGYAGIKIDKSKQGRWSYRVLDGVEGVNNDCVK